MRRPIVDILTTTKHRDDFQEKDLPHRYLRAVFSHWKSLTAEHSKKSGVNFLPSILQVSLDLLEEATSYTALVRLHDRKRGFDPYYIFAGQGLSELYGRHVPGKYLSDLLLPSFRTEPLEAYKRVWESRKPLFTVRKFRGPFNFMGYARIMLPLTEQLEPVPATTLKDEKEPNHVLLCIAPTKNLKTSKDWRETEDFGTWVRYLEFIEEDNSK